MLGNNECSSNQQSLFFAVVCYLRSCCFFQHADSQSVGGWSKLRLTVESLRSCTASPCAPFKPAIFWSLFTLRRRRLSYSVVSTDCTGARLLFPISSRTSTCRCDSAIKVVRMRMRVTQDQTQKTSNANKTEKDDVRHKFTWLILGTKTEIFYIRIFLRIFCTGIILL
jgi:hypothetical protein